MVFSQDSSRNVFKVRCPLRVQHYNSIRNSDDLGVGTAPEPIMFRLAKGDDAVASCSQVGKNAVTHS